MRRLAVCAALALCACGPAQTPAVPDPGTPPAAQATVATPAGPGEKIAARDEDERSYDYAVNSVVHLAQGGAKLFSTVGGDPAINGEYVYLAVLPDENPHEPPKIYKIGDFNSWSLDSQAPGQVVLKVSRSWIDDGGGIRTANERYIVAVPTWSASETTRAPAK